MTRNQLIAEARTYLGTPYIHLGRLKNAGVDCVGLIQGLLAFSGVPHSDKLEYNAGGGGLLSLSLEFRKYMEPVNPLVAQPGDVLVFWITRRGQARHCGIKTPDGLLHTHSGLMRVAEHRIDVSWQKRLMEAYRFPNIED